MYTRNAVDLHSESFRALPGRTLAGKTGAKHPKDCQLTFQKGKNKKVPSVQHISKVTLSMSHIHSEATTTHDYIWRS